MKVSLAGAPQFKENDHWHYFKECNCRHHTMQIDKEILRRFVARSAATVQSSRKRIREALGTSPSAAESTHGMVLAANFTLGPSADTNLKSYR